jgi:ADP-heptose:LPS heptosyltransferase
MRTPTVAIFGPTNMARLRDEPNVIGLQKGGRRHHDNVQRKREWWDDRSIDRNRPEDVVRASGELLRRFSPETAGR